MGRKVLLDKFKQLKMFTADMLSFASQFVPWKSQGTNSVLRSQAWAVAKLALKWRYLGYRLAIRAKKNPDNVGAASVDFLMFSGYAYMAFMWLQISAAAEKQLQTGEGDKRYLDGKRHTAAFSLSVSCLAPMPMPKPWAPVLAVLWGCPASTFSAGFVTAFVS